MKRDFFKRGNRMVHKFGGLEERSDPLQLNTFEPTYPVFPKQSSPGFEVRDFGERGYRLESSPVCKPGGTYATLYGPKKDKAEEAGRPMPVGTKRRKDSAKTDK